MRFIVLAFVLLIYGGCSQNLVPSYQITEFKEVAPGFVLAKADFSTRTPGFVWVRPHLVCENDTIFLVGNKKAVEKYYKSDSSMVLLQETGRLEVFIYNTEEFYWRHISNYKAEKDSLIIRSDNELVYPTLRPIEETDSISLEAFLEFPGWRRCD